MMGEVRTVLVADDDPGLLRAIATRLESDGFQVHLAQDAYQALHQARVQTPDLLILDINMPAGDGFSVQERIRLIPGLERVPVIYITGDAGETVEDQARRQGAAALLRKPFDGKTLRAAIRAAISHPESLPETICI